MVRIVIWYFLGDSSQSESKLSELKPPLGTAFFIRNMHFCLDQIIQEREQNSDRTSSWLQLKCAFPFSIVWNELGSFIMVTPKNSCMVQSHYYTANIWIELHKNPLQKTFIRSLISAKFFTMAKKYLKEKTRLSYNF